MAKQQTSFMSCSLIVAVLVIMCVSFSAAVLVRSTPSDSERVVDFVIAENRASASWFAFGRQWKVNLELSDVVEDNTDYFQGTLEGDSSAVVSFSLLPGTGLSGMIMTGSDTWWIRALPLAERGNSLDENDLAIFMQREQPLAFSDAQRLPRLAQPLEPIDHDDHNNDLHDVDANVDVDSKSVNEHGRRETITTYKVAVFYDQKWAQSSNNPWSSQADTIGLLNDVNAIYKAAGLNTFTFVYMKQVTNDKTTLNDMLSFFSNTASTSIAAINDKSYTNYLWLVGSNVGGLAYVGTTCQGSKANQNRKTAVTGLVSFSRLWTVKTIAHELGHNRGANHEFTNACTSTVTKNCQCSVMSYCFPSNSNNPSGAVNAFSAFSINEMTNAGCL